MIFIDFEAQGACAYIENTLRETEQPCWTPNQDEWLYEFTAVTAKEQKAFSYNPHDSQTAEAALVQAMLWVEDTIGPPVQFTPRWVLMLKSLMFWKYVAVRKGKRLVGLIPKTSGYTMEDFEKLQ